MTPSYTPKGKRFTELVLQIFRVNGRLLVEGDRLVAPLGQTSARWLVLGAVEESPATIPSIARQMGISRQSVQRTADILVADGLCEYVANPHHRKSSLLDLTPAGRKLTKQIGTLQTQWANRTAKPLGEKQLEAATLLLKEVERLLP